MCVCVCAVHRLVFCALVDRPRGHMPFLYQQFCPVRPSEVRCGRGLLCVCFATAPLLLCVFVAAAPLFLWRNFLAGCVRAPGLSGVRASCELATGSAESMCVPASVGKCRPSAAASCSMAFCRRRSGVCSSSRRRMPACHQLVTHSQMVDASLLLLC